MKKINYLMSIGLLLAVGCAHQKNAAENSSSGLIGDVKNQEQAKVAIENWNGRVLNLKQDALEVATENRFDFLKSKISKLESELSGARERFLKLRLAKSGDKQKYLNDLNREFNDMSEIYRRAE